MRRLLAAALASVLLAGPASGATLAVCADPSNLPYSDQNETGFENRIARLLADDLHADLRYTWKMGRRGFLRRTLLAHACDVVISVPADLGAVSATRPYFTSSYVFVTRSDAASHPESFDDPALRDLRIGLQLLGAEGANTPPAMSLARRGIVDHITGFPMWADEDVVNPQGRVIEAVAKGEIDVAIVWGPFAGYFAKPYADALRITPVAGDPQLPDLAFAYRMALGVRHGDDALRDRLQEALDRRAPEVRAILQDYAVPLVAP